MIKPEQIPDEVANAAADCYWSENNKYWQDIVAAAINAWPRMEVIQVYDDPEWEGEPDRTVIELPMPQEKNDD